MNRATRCRCVTSRWVSASLLSWLSRLAPFPSIKLVGFFFFFFFFSFLSSFVVLYVHINHKAYLERRWVQDGQLDFHTPPELLQMLLYVTETVRLIRDGEPRTATSIRLFTQFLSIFKCCFQSQLLVQTTLFTVSI